MQERWLFLAGIDAVERDVESQQYNGGDAVVRCRDRDVSAEPPVARGIILVLQHCDAVLARVDRSGSIGLFGCVFCQFRAN